MHNNNYYEKIIKVALGEDPDFDITSYAVPNASHLLMSDKDGKIVSQRDENEPDDHIYEIQFDYICYIIA